MDNFNDIENIKDFVERLNLDIDGTFTGNQFSANLKNSNEFSFADALHKNIKAEAKDKNVANNTKNETVNNNFKANNP